MLTGMVRLLLLPVVLVLAVATACSGGDKSGGAPTTSPRSTDVTTTTVDPYAAYSAAATAAGQRIIGQADAATRAALLCGQVEQVKSMFGGVPLSQFPTDLALVRAYCPAKESAYS